MSGGELQFHFFNIIVLTALVSVFVLWRYRSAVLRGMYARDGVALLIAPMREDRAPSSISAVDAETVEGWERAARRRIMCAVQVAIVPPSLILAITYLGLSETTITPLHLWLLCGVYAGGAVPIAGLILALPWRRALVWWLAYMLAFGCSVVAISMLQRVLSGRQPSLDQLYMNFFYLFQFASVKLWVPLLLMLATGFRRARGVAPIIFAGLFMFALAPLVGSRITAWLAMSADANPLLLAVDATIATQLGFLVLALPAGWLGWRRLLAVARAYDGKKFSDAQLLGRTWWLMIVAAESITLANVVDNWVAVLFGTGAAYVVFSPLLRWTLTRTQKDRPPLRELLLLRVFRKVDAWKTERLFDSVASRWRLFGPVTMIAAPDVAARTIDPGDFLHFASGRIAHTFVKSQEDLAARLATIDMEPDPDGRYRINDFCCRDNTWQATVVELMHRADAVVMDLRGVTESREGCEFELAQLAARVPADRVVLIINSATDQSVIERAMQEGGASRLPNLIELASESPSVIGPVFNKLISAAYSRC